MTGMTNINKYNGNEKKKHVHINTILHSLYHVHYVNYLCKKCHVYIYFSRCNF